MHSDDLKLFLRQLWLQGVELWLEGDQLRFRGDKKVVSGDTLSHLRAHKEALVELIRQNPHGYTGFPLSHGQRSIHLMQSMAPESFAYNQVCLLKLTDRLDRQLLESSLDFLLQRHAPLRMSIQELDGHLAQQVSYSLPSILSTEEVNITDDNGWRQWISTEADRPFDLRREPLIRARLLVNRLGTSPYHLLIVAHHIIADFWAMELIVKELETIYMASRQEKTPELPEIGKLYKDFVIHERDWLASSAGLAARSYWKEKLTPPPPPLELPADHTRPQRQSFQGQEQGFQLGQDLTARIRQQAKTAQVTPFVWVLSCFQLLLHRYTGENRIAIGSPVACRTQSDFQRLAGHFTNPVILLADFSTSTSFRELLQENREQTLQALKYQEYPLQCLIEELQPQRGPGTSPLFQVALSWNQLNRDHQHSGDLIDDVVMMGQRGAIYDLVLSCFDRGDDIQMSWRFNSDIFRPERIARLTGHLMTVLGKSHLDGNDPITGLDIRTPAEIKCAASINQTATAYPKQHNIAAIFHQQAIQFPQLGAFRHNNKQWSYHELDAYSNQLANFLTAQGIRPGQHIALCMNRSLDLLAAILATLKTGCSFVPINPEYPQDRITYIATATGAPLLVSQSSYSEKLDLLGNDICQTRLLYLDQHAREIAQASEEFAIHQQGRVSDNDVACVVFTSGSTGKPKGVQVPHRAISRLTINTNYIRIQPGERFLHLSNISFDAINIELWNALLNGGCVVCVDNDTLLNPTQFANLIREEKPQAAFVTTALFNLLVNHQPDIFGSLNYLLFGGEAHDINQIIKCVNAGKPQHLLHVYGPTENGSLSTSYEITEVASPQSVIPIGKPLSNNQAYIHDKYGQPVPLGVIGEIIVGGDGISTGYLNQPELTARQFLPDHYTGQGLLYATGDLGYLREDGNIVYAGRRDDQVKIRGYRIELGEVEQNISRHPLVNQCYVMVNDREGMPYLAAWYTASTPVEPMTIKKFLRTQLPEFMIPAALMQIEHLPMNANGKIDKHRLPEIRLESASAYVAPRTPDEQKIAQTWQQILVQERIGIHDNFFELGGHSLLAVRLASALQENLHLPVTMRMIFEFPCIADLTDALSAKATSSLPPIAPLTDRHHIPASLSQQRLWFLQQLDPGSRAYNMPVALRFAMPIKTSIIEKCIRTLVQRHEALHTTFRDEAGVAYLDIHPVENWLLPVIDLSQMKKVDAEREARNQINMLANTTFNTETGPLLKAVMIRISHNDHILALCLHHLVIDGWSVEILFTEFGILMQHFQHGENNPLPPLPIQYADFSHWQRQWLQGDLLNNQLGYWQQQLAGAPTLLNLPTDKPRPPVLGSAGANHHFTIPAATVHKLRTLGQHNNATLFMTLLAGFSILLSRYSQQSDICIGFPISGRNSQALEPLIGLFVNNLVIRCDLAGNPGFHDYLQQIRQTTLDAYANQDAPFDLIVDALKIKRSLSYTPLLQVSFSLEAETLAEKIRNTLGTRVNLETLDWHIAKYDINLTCHESAGEMSATLEYNTDLYETDSMVRMAQHFVRLLDEIANSGSSPINELQILTRAERQQFASSWQSQDAAQRPTLNVVNRFEIQAASVADCTALCLGEERLSYRELNERANQLAHFLHQQNIGAGHFVGLFLDRSINMVVAIIATLKTGAAYIPLDPKSPLERVNFIIEDAQISHVISTSDLAHQILVKNLINLDECTAQIASLPNDNLRVYIPNDTHAYVIYTSGTTGKPKGCLVTHYNMTRLFTVTEPLFHFDQQDVWTLFHSYAFDFSVWEMWGSLLYGGRLVIVPHWITRAPDAFYQLLQDEKVTILNQTPSAFSQVIAIDQTLQQPLCLRQIIFGGEALDFSALQRWADRHPLEQTALINMYGITETTVHATYHRLSRQDLGRGRSIIGKPLDDLHIHLLDTNGQHVPIGVLGEIYISGAGVTNGYLNRETLTNERFVPNPFAAELPTAVATRHRRMYRSGDLARRLANGDIEYLGRIDHQVKIRGHRIELGEIESVLTELAGVHESIVIAREDEPGNKRLVAYLLADASHTLDIGEIRQHLKASLPEYMVPAAFIVLSQWPLTANGKVDKLQLPAPGPGSLSSAEYIAPRNDTEQTICTIWSEVLGIDKVGVNDNFFELGGHSLLATQVASRIRSRLDCQLELKAIFENPTVAELAVVILEEEIGALAIDDGDLQALLAELSTDTKPP